MRMIESVVYPRPPPLSLYSLLSLYLSFSLSVFHRWEFERFARFPSLFLSLFNTSARTHSVDRSLRKLSVYHSGKLETALPRTVTLQKRPPQRHHSPFECLLIDISRWTREPFFKRQGQKRQGTQRPTDRPTDWLPFRFATIYYYRIDYSTAIDFEQFFSFYH